MLQITTIHWEHLLVTVFAAPKRRAPDPHITVGEVLTGCAAIPLHTEIYAAGLCDGCTCTLLSARVDPHHEQ